jgi:hypothetical protein
MTTHTQLTAPEAQMLTDRAVKLADELARTLVAIHDGNGHKALGYKTWTAFCEAHFDTPLRTIYRMMRQERVRIVLEGHANLARFTEEALDILGGDETYAYIETIANIAGDSTDGKINGQVIKAVKSAILTTIVTGAIELADGSQVSVKDALVDGVRGVLREDVLNKREYLAANVEALFLHGYAPSDYTGQVVIYLKDVSFDVYERMLEKPVHISIWRETE